MKVLHVIDSGGLYGAEVMLLSLMLAQREIGVQPLLVSIGTSEVGDKPVELRAAELGLAVSALRMKAGFNLAGARAIFRLAAEEDFDLLHSHGYKGNILLGLLPLWWRKKPLVTTLHGWTWSGKLNRMMFYESLDAISLRFVDHVVLVNSLMDAHPRLKGIAAEQRSVIDNGIDLMAADDRIAEPPPPGIAEFVRHRYTVVAVGRFSPEKGFSLLLEAIALLVNQGLDLQLLLLGEGRQRDTLAALAQELNIAWRVRMPGHVANVSACLAACQLFVMPSLTEGLPMALLEAMHAGIPIVASQVGGIPCALQDGECGMLIQAGDLEDLKEAIRVAYENPVSLVELARAAQNRLKSKYTSQAMANNYAVLYQSLVKHG